MAVNFEIFSVKFTLVIEFLIHNGRRSVSRIRLLGGFLLANVFGQIDVFFPSSNKVGLFFFQQRKLLLE